MNLFPLGVNPDHLSFLCSGEEKNRIEDWGEQILIKSREVNLNNRIFLFLFVLLGSFLRLHRLDLMEFTLDQVNVIITTQFWLGRGLPLVGQMSMSGLIMPPGFIYLLYPVVLLTVSPLGVASYVVILNVLGLWLIYRAGQALASIPAGLWACGLMAAHPWLIFYSRVIWPQSPMPCLTALFLMTVFHCLRQPRSPAIFWAAWLATSIWQVHYSGVCILIFFLPWLLSLALRRRINWSRLLYGLLAGELTCFPFLWFLINSKFQLLRQAWVSPLGEKIFFVVNLVRFLKLFG